MQIGSLQTPGAGSGGGDLIKDTTTQTFMADVVEASMKTPVIVDFWAPWCGPCKQLTPLLEKVVQAARGAVKLVKLNIDDHPEIAQQMRIQSIPAVFAFKNGQPVDGFMGALPESQLRSFVERLAGGIAPSPQEQMLEQAAAAFEAGDFSAAAQGFAVVLQEEPTNAKALAGLAKCYLSSGDTERAGQTLSLVPPEAENDPDVLSAKAALELAGENTADSGEVSELRAKLAANEADHQARFDLALALNASGDRAGAVDELLEIIRRDRQWNDEAARKKLLTLFEAFGPKDELTLSGRRRLSSLLFS